MSNKRVAAPRAMTAEDAASASELIKANITDVGDWRDERLAQIRELIREADAEVVEEVRWRKPSNPEGVPVWSHGGILCTSETYRDKVKLTFAKGASLPDPNAVCSTQACMATLGAPLTSVTAITLTKRHLKPSFAPQ